MQFLKMEGLSNDFIVTHGLTEDILSRAIEKAPLLCDRRRGIGADGIIFVLPGESDSADFQMRIINSDGSEPEMCGNGIRCFMVYTHAMSLTQKNSLSIETKAGLIKTEFFNEEIKVDMGSPILAGEEIPTTMRGGPLLQVPCEVDGKEYPITPVSMGNPHGVLYADSLDDDLVLGVGPKLESHPFFPNKANIEFIRVVNNSEIDMRVYERGCGETMACGTGACAAAVSGILNKKHDNRVTVHLLGGDLLIEWDGNTDHSVFMTGPARIAFRGEVDL